MGCSSSPWGERLIILQAVFPLPNFNPRSPWGERLAGIVVGCLVAVLISIHAPRGGSDNMTVRPDVPVAISIHAPRGGSDTSPDTKSMHMNNFNPRSPWGERLRVYIRLRVNRNFNPRSPWGERLLPVLPNQPIRHISIHAPRGGSDQPVHGQHLRYPLISIHAPRGGSDR